MSDMVQEHAYWGGARDRIPLSQTDAMAPPGAPQRRARRRAVDACVPHENLCLIRSGPGLERHRRPTSARMYLDDVEPVLRAGMDFLRDEGLRDRLLSPTAT